MTRFKRRMLYGTAVIVLVLLGWALPSIGLHA